MTARPRARRAADRDDDPVVREVRAIRRRLWRQAGGTVKGYFKLMQEMAADRKARPAARSGAKAAPKRQTSAPASPPKRAAAQRPRSASRRRKAA